MPGILISLTSFFFIATVERALAARFVVRGYPTVYHISKNRDARKYDGRRSLEELLGFVDGGYLEQEKISIWTSPFGPFGRIRGLFISAGATVTRVFEFLVVNKGISPVVAGAVLLAAAGACVAALVVALATLGFGEGEEHPHVQ